MDALAAGHDAAVQMKIPPSCAYTSTEPTSRTTGLTSKIHAVVDSNGLPVHLALTPGEAHDNRLCSVRVNLKTAHQMAMLFAAIAHSRFWHKADLTNATVDVRYWE